MAFDAGLGERIREALDGHEGVTERKMFGGLAFMVEGHMAVGIIGDTLMVRAGPDRHAQALARPHARPMTFTGRSMVGFITVDPAGFEEDADLREWIGMALEFVATLPPPGTVEGKRRPRSAGSG